MSFQADPYIINKNSVGTFP